MKDYFKIEEGQEINSLQDVYLTHTTIMINLIDTDTYDSMMVRVCKDIYENDKIVEDAKKLRRKQRMLLGSIIYDWAKNEWNNHPTLPQARYSISSHGWRMRQSNPFGKFLDRFEEAFHTEVLESSQYKYNAKYVHFNIKDKNDTYNIVMYENPQSQWYRDIFGRMIVKYNKRTNTLRIGYIENIEWSSYLSMSPQKFRVEMFRAVRMIMNRIENEKGEEPKVTCHKKYDKLLNKAIELGYLEKKKPKEIF